MNVQRLLDVLSIFMPIQHLLWTTQKVETNPMIPIRCIDSDSRIDWAHWLKQFDCIEIDNKEISFCRSYFLDEDIPLTYGTFTTRFRFEQSLDLHNIYGLSSSKENLSDFTSLYEMAESTCQGLLEKDIDTLLQWRELSLEPGGHRNSVSVFGWDTRKFLMNSGGSHHFAAAVYRSLVDNDNRQLELPLVVTMLNHRNIKKLLDDVALFHSPDHNYSANIRDALTLAGITFTTCSSPYARVMGDYRGSTFVVSKRNWHHKYVVYQLNKVLENIGTQLISLLDIQDRNLSSGEFPSKLLYT